MNKVIFVEIYPLSVANVQGQVNAGHVYGMVPSSLVHYKTKCPNQQLFSLCLSAQTTSHFEFLSGEIKLVAKTLAIDSWKLIT